MQIGSLSENINLWNINFDIFYICDHGGMRITMKQKYSTSVFCPFVLDSIGSLLNILFINKLILTWTVAWIWYLAKCEMQLIFYMKVIGKEGRDVNSARERESTRRRKPRLQNCVHSSALVVCCRHRLLQGVNEEDWRGDEMRMRRKKEDRKEGNVRGTRTCVSLRHQWSPCHIH